MPRRRCPGWRANIHLPGAIGGSRRHAARPRAADRPFQRGALTSATHFARVSRGSSVQRKTHADVRRSHNSARHTQPVPSWKRACAHWNMSNTDTSPPEIRPGKPREHDDKASFGPQAVARPRPMAIRQVNTATRGKGRIKPRLAQVERMGGVDGAAGAIEAAHSMPREEGTHLNDHRVSSRDATTVRLPADVRASFLSLPSPSRRRSRPRPRERRATLRSPSQVPVLPHRRRRKRRPAPGLDGCSSA